MLFDLKRTKYIQLDSGIETDNIRCFILLSGLRNNVKWWKSFFEKTIFISEQLLTMKRKSFFSEYGRQISNVYRRTYFRQQLKKEIFFLSN